MKPLVMLPVFVLITLLLAACVFQSAADPTQDISGAYTQAARTIVAQFTRSVQETVLAQPEISSTSTPTPRRSGPRQPPPKELPTESPQPTVTYAPALPTTLPQPTLTPENSPVPSDTSIPATATSLPLPDTALASPTPPANCLRMEFLGDVTIPPDTVVLAGSSFVKVWRVRNTGTCTWTADYALVFSSGNLAGDLNTVFLPYVVTPGNTVDLAVTLTAPPFNGTYLSSWLLRSPRGEQFGYGTDGSVPLSARVRTVLPTYTHNYPYDIAFSACTGVWRSGAGLLSCPGEPQSRDGFVVLVNTPQIENEITREYGLWVRPDRDRLGYIRGEMPYYAVTSGDHFLADVGCMNGSLGCDVTFELSYRLPNGTQGSLGSWRETYDGVSTSIDIDLSFLNGRSVALILTTSNDGDPRQADGVWLLPRVQKLLPSNAYTLIWTREGLPDSDDCHTLRVSLSGPRSGQTIAYDCSRGNRELGRAALTSDQASQLYSWVQRLSNFEGEVYTSASNHPVISWVDFHGVGNNASTDADIQTMNSFANQLFSQITLIR